jgi:tellurite resistance protein
MPIMRIPPNFFGIAFGLAGLAEAWRAAGTVLGTPPAVPGAISILAAAVWVVTVAGYAAQGPRQILADLRDPVLAPFVPLAAITGMLLAATLAGYAFAAGRVLVLIFLAVTIAVGGWLTGQWIAGELDQDAVHSGYFLPTVAGGLVGGFAAAQVHLHSIGEASFGIGVVCWFFLGSIVLNRLFFGPTVPPALVPTMAIQLAPPAVAAVAYAALTGRVASPVGYALAGYAVLMVLVQFRLLPLYLKLRYTPGFWAFTFSYAAAATDALGWITRLHPAGAEAYAVAVIAVITAFIAAIAARTVIAVARGQFLPATHGQGRTGEP